MTTAIETNEINQIGVKPASGQDSIRNYSRIPDGATQIVKASYANNATVTLHTVGSGVTLYLCAATVSAYNTAGAVISGYMEIRNAATTIIYYLPLFRFTGAEGRGASTLFVPPMELGVGCTIKIVSTGAQLTTLGSIFGYEM